MQDEERRQFEQAMKNSMFQDVQIEGNMDLFNQDPIQKLKPNTSRSSYSVSGSEASDYNFNS